MSNRGISIKKRITAMLLTIVLGLSMTGYTFVEAFAEDGAQIGVEGTADGDETADEVTETGADGSGEAGGERKRKVRDRGAQREFASGGEESGGDHDDFAGEGDEGAFHRHEKEDEGVSASGGKRGRGVEMCG